METKYKVGDRVKIKSLDWYNQNKDKDGIVELSTHVFVPGMSYFCGKVVRIEDIFEYNDDNAVYYMDGIDWDWTDEMIECKIEEYNDLVKDIDTRFNGNINQWLEEYANRRILDKVEKYLREKIILYTFATTVDQREEWFNNFRKAMEE